MKQNKMGSLCKTTRNSLGSCRNCRPLGGSASRQGLRRDVLHSDFQSVGMPRAYSSLLSHPTLDKNHGVLAWDTNFWTSESLGLPDEALLGIQDYRSGYEGAPNGIRFQRLVTPATRTMETRPISGKTFLVAEDFCKEVKANYTATTTGRTVNLKSEDSGSSSD